MRISLDKVYRAPSNKPVLLVVDTRVALYMLLSKYLSIRKSVQAAELWQYYLNCLPSIIHPSLASKKDVYLICVDDWRSGSTYNYWREDWLKRNSSHCSVYKGNRGTTSEADRPDGYSELLNGFREYTAKANIPVFREEGFEADDFAGSCYRIANGNWQTILVSIDNDWGQLVCNKKDIIQYINGAFKVPISRLRSEREIYRYYYERHDEAMTNTYEIVDYKAEYGDAGDNIAAGSPREIIDLRYPPVRPADLDLSLIFSYQPCNAKAAKSIQKIGMAEFA